MWCNQLQWFRLTDSSQGNVAEDDDDENDAAHNIRAAPGGDNKSELEAAGAEKKQDDTRKLGLLSGSFFSNVMTPICLRGAVKQTCLSVIMLQPV